MSFRVTGTHSTQLFPTFRRHFSQPPGQAHFSSIKKTPSLEDVDASCIVQQSHPYTSKKGKEYEIIVDLSVFPRRNTYKGQEIIQKKLEIDPHFRSQVESMKKLVYEKLDEQLRESGYFDPDWYLMNSLRVDLIEEEPLISKNGKRFECNAWVHSEHRQSCVEYKKHEEEGKLQTVQITDANKLQEVSEEVEAHEALLPSFHPWVIPPSWLKEHPDTSLQFNRSVWKHPSGSRYEISLWVHSMPEDINKKGIKDLSLRIKAAGQPLTNKIETLKRLAAERLSLVLEQRKPPICIAAVKASMIAEGAFPLCSDVHIAEYSTFEISAHVSKQPEQEAVEVNEALKSSAKKCRPQFSAFTQYGMIFFYRPLVGSAPDNPLEGIMHVESRLEETKDLIKRAEEGCRFAREHLGWLARWERLNDFSDIVSSSREYQRPVLPFPTFKRMLADRKTPGDATSDESMTQGPMEEKQTAAESKD